MRVSLFSGVVVYAAAILPAQADDTVYHMGDVTVVGVTPVMGAGLDLNKVPANVQTISPADQRALGPSSVADLLNNRLGSVSTADYQGNPLQPSLSFRGFTASSTLGEPQGLAVYQNGMRLNEAFGDLVNWDMNPSFAIDTMQVLPGSNPVFGLNALGGAVAIRMKDGFTSQGNVVQVDGGTFGRARLTAETGQQFGDFAFYSGVSAQNDDGWRQSSPSKLAQSYTDLAVRRGDLDLGMGITLAGSNLSGLGTSPMQLLEQARDAVFTSPDGTQNALAATDMRANYQWSPTTSLQGSLYYRHLRSATFNGDASDFSACDANPAQLCDDSGNALTYRNGGAIPSTDGTGILSNTLTTSDGIGAAGQVSHDGKVMGHTNNLIGGVSVDQGWTRYQTNAELGSLSSNRVVLGSGNYIDGSAYNVLLNASNTYTGLYLTDTFSLTDRLHLTAAGRFNTAAIQLHDDQGTALSGDHSYQRFNPSLGLTWQVVPGVTTYGSYSEANRVPTAAELTCADPTQPCRVPNAFTSDPGLKQVVSRSFEVGLRGKTADAGDKLEWSLAAYSTRNTDDIIFVSSGPYVGGGYFSNAGATLRQGLEANTDAHLGRWTLNGGYGLTRAVFDSALTIQSPQNSAADANGNIQVRPGDRMPGIPLHMLKLGADFAVTGDWTVGADAQLSSARFLRGDESNTMPTIPGYAVFNASSTYQLLPNAQVMVRVRNLLDHKYATAGTLGDPTPVFPSFTDNRFEAPGEPRSLWVGMRVTF